MKRVFVVALLVEHFLKKFNERLKKSVSGVEPDALELLSSYSWPGNIRELENVIERAVLFADSPKIRLEDLSEELRGAGFVDPGKTPIPAVAQAQATPSGEAHEPAAASDGLKEQVKAAMSRLERDLIIRALKQTQNNVTHAARLLKISRKGLQLKMKELNLRERDPE